MTGTSNEALRDHLLRADHQEDVVLATYRLSSGRDRRSAVLRDIVPPKLGEREVHGNASLTTSYVLRAARLAAKDHAGLLLLHSHPHANGWQQLSRVDQETEAGFANLARELTGLPLVGMTLAGGDGTWSGRWWDRGVGRAIARSDCENVRVFGDRLVVSWNDILRPPPPVTHSQKRTVHSWGDKAQADLARLRVLVVGAGSVGLTVATVLAATGVEHVAVMDHDSVYFVNLDRLLHATRLDASLGRSKSHVARRSVMRRSTSQRLIAEASELSVCEAEGFERMLDFDVVFSCVDRPWPRHVLNTASYADLIPVIDGGIHIDPLPSGGMRGAIWRSHVVGPGRPCLVCNGQYDPGDVAPERDGTLDDPSYIAGLPPGHRLKVSQNVAALSVSCAGSLMAQFISLTIAPGGLGDPGPIRYHLAPHLLERDSTECIPTCPYPRSTADGDGRVDPTGTHAAARDERHRRRSHSRRTRVRVGIALDNGLDAGSRWLASFFAGASH